MNRQEQKLLDTITKLADKKVVLWGASNFLSDFLEKCPDSFNNIVGIVDKDITKAGKYIGSYRIYLPQALSELGADCIVSAVINNSKSVCFFIKLFLSVFKLNIELMPNIFAEDIIGTEHLNYCPICKNTNEFLPMGLVKDKIRPHAKCPVCKSLERHRFLYFLYKMMLPEFNNQHFRLLHIAPELSLYSLFAGMKNIEYTATDLFPENFPFVHNCVKQDILNTTFDDNSFDVIICNHVLEHIEDESGFFKEINRILSDNGRLFLSVPYALDINSTLELDYVKTPEDRLKYYGQDDHVRLYGQDVFDRFSKYGKTTVVNTDIFPVDFARSINIEIGFDSKYKNAVVIFEKTS